MELAERHQQRAAVAKADDLGGDRRAVATRADLADLADLGLQAGRFDDQADQVAHAPMTARQVAPLSARRCTFEQLPAHARPPARPARPGSPRARGRAAWRRSRRPRARRCARSRRPVRCAGPPAHRSLATAELRLQLVDRAADELEVLGSTNTAIWRRSTTRRRAPATASRTRSGWASIALPRSSPPARAPARPRRSRRPSPSPRGCAQLRQRAHQRLGGRAHISRGPASRPVQTPSAWARLRMAAASAIASAKICWGLPGAGGGSLGASCSSA